MKEASFKLLSVLIRDCEGIVIRPEFDVFENLDKLPMEMNEWPQFEVFYYLCHFVHIHSQR